MILKNLSIHAKHNVILVLVIGGLVLTALLAYHQFSKLLMLAEAQYDLEQIESEVAQLRNNEKDFLLDTKREDRERFVSNYSDLNLAITDLNETLVDLGVDTKASNALQSEVQQYNESFIKLADLQEQLGLSGTTGLYGDLRNSARALENSAEATDNYEILYMVMLLRRHEKNFLMRKDEVYVDSFFSDVKALDMTVRGENQRLLKTFKDTFQKVVEFERVRGLKATDGIRGQLKTNYEEMQGLFEQLRTRINETLTSMTNTVYITLASSVILAIVILAGLIITVSRAIYLPVQRITEKVEQIAHELDLTPTLDYQSNDEIGVLSKSFDRLISMLRQTVLKVQSGATEVGRLPKKCRRSPNPLGTLVANSKMK